MIPIVETYVTKDNNAPLDEWLDAIRDRKTRNVIKVRINRLRNGIFGDCEPVGGGVFELKIDYGPGFRVYFWQAGDRVLLLNGGDKDTQFADINKAKVHMEDHMKRRKSR